MNGRIDQAIDAAARAMTAGEPSAAFRATVMARLDERRAPLMRWILSAAAVAAVLAIVLFIPRDRGTEPPPLASRAILGVVSVPGTEPPARVKDIREAAPAGTRGVRFTERQSEVAALAPPALDVASIALAAIAPGASIQIQELETIAPITIAPIGEPQGERR